MKKSKFFLSCLIVALLVFSGGEFLFVDSVYADQTPPDGPDDHGIGPDGLEIPEPCNQNDKEEDDNIFKDPVSITGGKIFIPEIDLSFNGNGLKTGIAYLNFSRSFSSQSNLSSGLGKGWTNNAEIHLQQTASGATIISGMGKSVNFVYGENGYISPECGDVTLTTDGNLFTWQLRYGTKYVFEASGLAAEPGKFVLKYIEDRYGNRIDYEYQEFDDQSLGGMVKKITKMVEPETGRFIQINWQEYNNGQENLYLISSIKDSSDRIVSYEYDLDFNLYKGYQASLKKVTDPEGYTQEYNFVFNQTADTTILKSFNVKDKNGNLTVYNFNQPFESATDYPDWNWNLRVASVVDSNGNIMQFTTDEALGLTTYIDKNGNPTMYQYRNMKLIRTIYANGNSKQYFYDERGNRIKFIDVNDNEWLYGFDPSNFRYMEIDPLGNSEKWIRVEADYKWTSKIDKNGNVWLRELDDNASIVSETDPLGNKVTYTYDEFGNQLSKTDAKGNSSNFVYDASGNMTAKTDYEGNTSQFTYDSVGNILTETDALGHTTSYSYDKLGRMLTKTSPGGDTEEYVYDGNGNVTSFKDANDNITTYEYDGMNKIKAVHLPDGTDITYEYNAMSKLIAEHKPSGTWTYEYDNRNRIIKKIDPLNNETVFTYDGTPGCGSCGSTEKVSTVTDALGNTTSFEYDPLGRKILEKDANNKAIEYQYDANGNLIKGIDKLNHETSYNYDDANRLISVTNHLGDEIEITYDPNSNKTQVKDPKANITTYAYDKNNRNIEIINALGGQTLFAYDPVGNRISITDAENNLTQFEYNAENNLIKLMDAAGTYEQYEYDNSGNLIKKINSRNQDIGFAYDNLNRLIQKTLPNNQIIRYTYDTVGNLVAIADEMGSRSYEYDSLGRVTKVVFPGDLAINYEYDAAGNRSKLIYPSGTTVNYAYNNLNLLSSITVAEAGVEKIFSFSYDDKSRKTQLVYPNGIITNYSYDEVDRLLSIAVGQTDLPGSIENISYTYDANSNRTQRTDNLGIHNYTYDQINQLINVNYPDNINQTYAFDNVGNRTNFTKITSLDTENISSQFNQLNQLNSWSSSLLAGGDIVSLSGILADDNIDYISVNSQTATIDSDTFTINDLQLNPGLNTLNIAAIDKAGNSNQQNIDITLNNTVNAVYAYDLDGNLISNSVDGTTWNYNWNAENKLIKASSSLGKSIDYVYYEDGNLGSKTSQDTTKYIYDGIHCIAKYDQDNNLINEIVYGPQIDEVLCSIDSSDTAHYYHQDALQSVVAITDGFANKSATYEYDVYGKIKDKTGSFDNEITYTGRWLDVDTGLYYYRARWYDADNGRFISRDPIGIAGGINLYGYVGGNPVNRNDPTGEISRDQLAAWILDLMSLLEVTHFGSIFDFFLNEAANPSAKAAVAFVEDCNLSRSYTLDSPLGSGMKRHYCYYWCFKSGYRFTKHYDDCSEQGDCPSTHPFNWPDDYNWREVFENVNSFSPF